MSTTPNTPRPTTGRILFASLIGTTIEFFDFYIFATAAVLVFPKLFFPKSDPTSAILESFATFALAFFARPIGSAIFGHFGDRIGRKATLVAALMTMGLSTVLIGLLPTYASIGVVAPLLLALCRVGQGLGLGGEWGGAVLLAREYAPAHRRGWFGMFPQLGAPIGFILSSSTFLLLTKALGDQGFYTWGWRLPFIVSALLVIVGLWVRLRLEETPEFAASMKAHERVKVPMARVFSHHSLTLVLGVLAAVATFVLFYLMTVFALSWGTTALHFPRSGFLMAQMIGMAFFALGIPVAAWAADRFGAKAILITASFLILLFGLIFAPLFAWHQADALVFLVIGLFLMGLTYGPLGTGLAELFPTPIRYTGISLAFNLAGILGASLAPYIATWLAKSYGLAAVGYYLSGAAFLTLVALLVMQRVGKPAPLQS